MERDLVAKKSSLACPDKKKSGNRVHWSAELSKGVHYYPDGPKVTK